VVFYPLDPDPGSDKILVSFSHRFASTENEGAPLVVCGR
jgi:hypothetical protein